MKRILVCASRISHILNFHLPCLRYFKEQGYIVDVVSEGKTEHELIDNCYDMRFVKNPLSAQNLKTVKALKKLLRENHYSMIYSNSTLAGAALKLAYFKLKKPRPYFVHISHGYMFSDDHSLHSMLYRTVERLTAKAPDALVVMNRKDMELAEKYKLGKTLHYIDGMGLCPDKFPPVEKAQKDSFRAASGLKKDDTVLLCVGELSARKNQTMLIKALDIIRRSDKRAVMVFAGNGKAMNECKLLAEKYELAGCVRFMGHTNDVNTLYRSSDILISGSKMEGLPFNVMEALYCGLPVIASDIKGHSDLITDGVNGLLFDINSDKPEENAAQAILRVISDPELYSKLKANAFLDKKFLIENVQPKLLSILDKEYKAPVRTEATEGA